MKTSEALRRVRDHLRDGGYMVAHERWGCYAAEHLYLRGQIGDRDRTKVKRVLRKHLDGYSSLEAWLEYNHGIPVAHCTPAKLKKIMATRKAWLTHLIEHYEAKGE